jgi:hypothetical protein
MTDLITVICDKTMQAAADVISYNHYAVDVDNVCKALREEIKMGYDGLLAEMKDAADAHMGETMLATILATGCRQFAINAIKAAGA